MFCSLVLLSSWWPLRAAACFAGKKADCVSRHAEPFLPFPFQEEISSRICLLSSWRRLKIKAERDQRVVVATILKTTFLEEIVYCIFSRTME